MFLECFHIPSRAEEECILDPGRDIRLLRTCYPSYYPFGVFPEERLEDFDFEPVTIFYGGNGSGKTTLLNLIGEKIGAQRKAPFNSSPFFQDYVRECEYEAVVPTTTLRESKMITSDDVFDHLLDARLLNEGLDVRREELLEEFVETKYASFQLKSIDDFDELKRHNQAKGFTGSRYVKKRMMKNIREKSNGETAFIYFTENIQENMLYILDEPENSLSAEYQIQLAGFLEDSARFYGCQFILATHSPFLLAIEQAKIYDLDARPVCARSWTELENVRAYYDFFKSRAERFE